MADRNMTFLPGEEPGLIAGGLKKQADVQGLMEQHLGMPEIPTGNKVARWFPWWRTVTQTLSDSVRRIIPNETRDPTSFFNNSNKDVYIDEIRMRVIPSAWDSYIYNQTAVLVKMSIPDRREIISDWLPWAALQTSPESMLLGELDNYVYEFPAPYFLQRDQLFLMDFQYDANIFVNGDDVGNVVKEEYALMMGLHGFGQRDKEPISLVMPAYGWQDGEPDATSFQTIAFDDRKSHPLRDAWITHLTFGSAIRTNSTEILQAVMVRPNPPAGPAWHRQEFYRLDEIAHQVGSDHAGQEFMIHRPKVPYVLHKGEGMVIELLYDAVIAAAGVDSEVTITMLGRQEGEGR